jgi:hypothetical protein
MKRWLLFLVGGLLLAPGLWAQVKVELVMDQEQFLPREPLMVGVRIMNLSGQILQLGREDDWLQFIVEAGGGSLVLKERELTLRGEFKVESSQVATRFVDLAPYYPLTATGRYRVTAIIKIAQWGETIVSRPKEFDIIKGAKMWEQEFGVPPPANRANAMPEVRKYILQKASYLKQLRLYVRVTSVDETQVYRVFALGPLVSFSRPEAQLDKDSNLHLLYQSGARSFSYGVINPDGQLLTRQIHEYSDTRPVLRPDGQGNVKVVGGRRRLSSDDLPAASRATNATSFPSPTNAAPFKP